MRFLFFFSMFVLMALSAACVNARLPPVTLEKLVGFSNFIFVGSVYSRGDDPVLRGSFNTWGLLRIDVERSVCGRFFEEEWPDGRIEVLYPLNPIERPSFDPGSRYLFFLRESHSGPQLAPSFYGAARIDGDVVHMEDVGDIGRPLPLQELTEMIDCRAATGIKELF
jgi:hypothetical protein